MHFSHKVQSFLVMISSRVVVMLHVLPSSAPVGHTSTQMLQSPHLVFCSSFVAMKEPVGPAQQIAHPPSVTSRLFLPIVPSPARCTTQWQLLYILLDSAWEQNCTCASVVMSPEQQTPIVYKNRAAILMCCSHISLIPGFLHLLFFLTCPEMTN